MEPVQLAVAADGSLLSLWLPEAPRAPEAPAAEPQGVRHRSPRGVSAVGGLGVARSRVPAAPARSGVSRGDRRPRLAEAAQVDEQGRRNPNEDVERRLGVRRSARVESNSVPNRPMQRPAFGRR